MIRRLPGPIIGVITSVLALLNTLLWCVPVYALIFAKIIVPVPRFRRICERALMHCAENWITGNNRITKFCLNTSWDIRGLEGLSRDGRYLLSVNHQSLIDILVLQQVFNRRVPFLKFFIKQQLIWTPILGLVWWGLDFPFMKRYSKERIERQPHLRGKDLETTRRKCAHFCTYPFSIINFLEGTRFTPQKHAQQGPNYSHLLNPKAGGIAFVLAAVAGNLDEILDVTIAYDSTHPTFWEFLCNRIPRIIVSVRSIEIPDDFVHGDYIGDPLFREQFQTWVRQLWSEKDLLLADLVAEF